MKKLVLIIFLYVSIFGFSQNKYNPKLNVKYSDEYLQKLSKDELLTLEFYLDNIYIIENNFKKNKTLPELYKINNSTKQIIKEPLSSIDFNNFNILEYNFTQNYDTRNCYKIGNTGKTLIILSMKEYVDKLNNSKNL